MNDSANIKTGQRIRKLRHDKALTQLALASAIGVESNTLARLERGEHRASTDTLERLAKAFKVTVSDILGH